MKVMTKSDPIMNLLTNYSLPSKLLSHLPIIFYRNTRPMSGPTDIVPTVLLSCGSFNPITNMHLRMFELARDYLHRHTQYRVMEAIISPTNDKYQTIQTTKRLEKSEHRCQMARLAVTSLEPNEPNWVRVDDWEAKQQDWVSTREVIDFYYEKVYDKKFSLKLLCGADLFHSFNVPDLWKDEDIHKIVGKYGMVVITRHGSDPFHTLERSHKSEILLKYKNNIVIVEEKIQNMISSTLVRNAIRNGESVRYFVPDLVIGYIIGHRLYQD